MKRLLSIIFPLALFAVGLFSSSKEGDDCRPFYTADIAIVEDGSLLMANAGRNEVRMVDSSGVAIIGWKTSAPATGVVVHGKKAYFTASYDKGYLYGVTLDGDKSTIDFVVETDMGACSPVVSHDGEKIYVCNRYKSTLSQHDAQTGEKLGEVKLQREPCDAVLTKDGKYLYVCNFLPAQRADVDYVAADVSVVDCEQMQLVKDIKLSNGSNALRGIAISEDGKYIFVAHNLGRYQVPTSQLQQGWMNTNAISVISAESQSLIGSISMDEPDRGAGGTWDVECSGEYLVVSHSGTHEVSVVEYGAMIEKLLGYGDYSKLDYDLYFMQGIRKRIPLYGNGPRKMVVADGKAYVPTYFSDTLNIVNLTDQSVEYMAYNPTRQERAVDKGERAFNDASLCYQNWQSCNGCHPGNGRTDGMNWDLMNDGIGNPKNCKSMLLSFDTPRCMISGIREHAGLAVRAGYKFIQFCDVEESVAECVDQYIKSLKPLPSPYLVDGKLSEKAVAGRKLYAKHGCADCHSGVNYTDMQMHRIGEDVEFDEGWDTPTLREVWRTAPYLFDGRAATMEEVFAVYKHGIKGKISAKEAEALAEYVNSL